MTTGLVSTSNTAFTVLTVLLLKHLTERTAHHRKIKQDWAGSGHISLTQRDLS